MRPLVVSGLMANFLSQAREAEVFITTDHEAFYDDILEQEEYEQQFEEGWASHPNYRDDPHFDKIRQKHSLVNPQF